MTPLYIELNFTKITLYVLIHALFHYKFRQELHRTFTSLITTIMYLYNHDRNDLIAYYLYDILCCISSRKDIYTLHHILTLYSITVPIHHPDYILIMSISYLLKITDLPTYGYKISKRLQFHCLQKILLFVSIIVWGVFRGVLPFYWYKLFNNTTIIYIAIALHVASIIWIWSAIIKLKNSCCI